MSQKKIKPTDRPNARWINTRVEYQWDGEQYVEVSTEGYWYDGPMALAHNQAATNQVAYRFYESDNSTTVAAQNATGTISADTPYVCRILWENTGDIAEDTQTYQLQYQNVTQATGWQNVTGASTHVQTADASGLTNGNSVTAATLTGQAAATFTNGEHIEDGVSASIGLGIGNYTEYWFAFQVLSANANNSDNIQLRIVGSTLGVLDVYTNTPDITASVPLPERTGSLTAQESGSDTFAATGGVTVAGGLTAQESGSDTFSASGTVSDPAITGSLTAQETGTDTFAATGDVDVAGSLTVQESGADTLSASGEVALSGSLAVQETGADTLSVTGAVAVDGSLTAQESGTDTFAATGTVGAAGVTGSLTAQESGVDTLSASGAVVITGSVTTSESGADTLSASGGVLVSGGLSVQEAGSDLFAASGTVISGIVGSLVAQEVGSDTANFVANVLIDGALAAVESGADTITITATVTDRSVLSGARKMTIKLEPTRTEFKGKSHSFRAEGQTQQYTVRLKND